MNRITVMNGGIRSAAFVGVAVIVFLSAIPAQLQIRTGASKELEHAAAYLLVASIWTAGFVRAGITGIVVGMLLAAMAGMLEFVQHWIPDRTPSLTDWVSGTAGALTGVTCHFLIGTMWWKSANLNITDPALARRWVPKEPRVCTDEPRSSQEVQVERGEPENAKRLDEVTLLPSLAS
jgi:VanZ family protein